MTVTLSSRYIDDEFTLAGREHGTNALGDCKIAELLDSLEKLRSVTIPPDEDVTPEILVESPLGFHRIVIEGDKFVLSNLDDINEQSLLLGREEIRAMYFPVDTMETEEEEDEVELPDIKRSVIREMIFGGAATLIFVGLAAFWIHFYVTHSVSPFPELEITEISDAETIAEMTRDYTGAFISGTEPGDVLLSFSDSGAVRIYDFFESDSGQKTVLDFDLEAPYRFVNESNGKSILIESHDLVRLIGKDEIEYDGLRLTRFVGSYLEEFGEL